MKSITWKRSVCFALALVLLLAAVPVFGLSASAAASWPWLSSSAYCEYVSPGKISVYRDSGLTIRGASNRSYNAYIDGGDVLKIYEITGSYTYLSYPTSSGSKTGYVKTSSLFGVSTPSEKVTSRGKVTTYKTTSGSQSGYVASGDEVYKLGSAGNGSYTLVMYTAKSGSRAYKAAFVRSSDYSTITGGSSGSAGNVSSGTTLTNALYGINTSGSKITCGFDGYVTLRQKYGYRHEGIDFGYGSGKPVYSLTDGVVTNVVYGSSGSLSTVAIYYAAADKTIVYLHMAPTVAAGATVERGSQIGTESSRGANGVVHTHVEVRSGYRTNAAVSKDATLVNSNPTAFWNSLGYTVK